MFRKKISGSKPPNLSWEKFEDRVKRYYRDIEVYDWTDTADNFRGPESLLHKYREWFMLALIRPYLKSHPRARALDVGCGTGLMLRHLPKGSIGLDINPRNLARLKKWAPQAKGVLVDIEAKGIPYPKESFDLAAAAEVLEHLLYPERAVVEIYRVLKPGGLFAGSVPMRSLFWRLRFLSVTYHSTTEHYEMLEPFHNEMTTMELRMLLATKFSKIRLYPAITNIFFVASK
ncbi:hypothetical protein A2V68_01675 [candidate division Kazan bacterium RBG_13_50_9]|uniref:Methyltransferase type 11 domain-containing protein n=1 Tax=candidate division Kazan bacterium RBG_13_50_9 TaxID=1798535 RepID=A0A1F4NSD8_UNCK3|nr:MAG: hypothetical protein A2V68_01675 [candidate division Kazan bacterium RBG_13_50_9]